MRSIALLVLVIFTWPLYAQKLKYRIEHIGSKQGLSQGSVYSMFKDSNGHMWFGTLDGLNFWNGKTMKVYRPSSKDKYSIEGIEIKKIIGYGISDLLIGTENCLNIYESEKDRFKKVYFRNSTGQVIKSEVFPIGVEGSELKLWLSGVGLINYNFITKKQTILVSENRFRTDYFSNINTTQSDLGDNIWLHTDEGLLKYNTKSKNLSYYFSNNTKNIVGKKEEIVKIHVDREIVWLGTFDGFVKFNSKTFEIEKWTDYGNNRPIGHVFDIVSDKNGKVWIGTERNGLLCFDTKFETFERISNKGSFSNFKLHNDEISHVYIDPDGIIWANTDPYGVDKIQILPGNFGTYRLNLEGKLPQSMQNFSIRSIVKDGDILWLGTQQSGVWRVNASDFNIIDGFYNLRSTVIPSNTVRYMHKDQEGTVWLGTSEGLAYFQNGKFREIAGSQNKMSKKFIRVLEEFENKLWIGTEEGIFVLDKRSKKAEGIGLFGNKRITMLKFLAKDRLLVGIYNDGLFEVTSSDGFNSFNVGRLVADCIPTSILKLQDQLWVGTSNGLVNVSLLTKKTKWIKREDGLPSEFIYAIESDDFQNLWLSTNKGIVKFEPNNNRKFFSFNLNDGLQDFEFNGYSSFKDSDGQLFFGGVNGLNYFFPSQIQTPRNQTSNILFSNHKNLTNLEIQSFKDIKNKFQKPELENPDFLNSFSEVSKKIPNYSYADKAVWAKFAIRNNSSSQWFMEIENCRLNKVEVWVYEKGNLVFKKNGGDVLPIDRSDFRDVNPIFELDLIENQEYEFFIRAETNRDLKLPIGFWQESSIAEHVANKRMIWGVYIGFIILIAFYNLFLWLSIKDLTYFYYMCYVITFGLFQFSVYGLFKQYIWNDQKFNEYAFILFLFISNIFIVLFTESFLEMRTYLPHWFKIKKVLIGTLGLATVATPFMFNSKFQYVAITISASFNLIYIYTFIVYHRLKLKIIYFYALAIGCLIIASFLVVLQNLAIINALHQEYVIMVGSMFEIVLFSLALGYKYRQNQLEKERQQMLRNQISGNLHDDLAASLSSLTMYTELSKRKLDLPQNELLERFERISFKSREILGKVREAVYELNPKNDGEEEWLERILNFGKEIFESKNIEFMASIHEGFDSRSLVSEHRREVFLIFKEAMNNAAKYSEATTVVFEVKKVIGAKEFRLKDNGVGFGNTRMEAGNGLSNIKERAKKMNAQLVINSQNGTEIILITG